MALARQISLRSPRSRFERLLLTSGFALVPLLFQSSCAIFGGGGESLQRAKGYQITAPAGWKVSRSDEADKAYHLESGSVATASSACHRYSEAPLDVLTRQLLIGSRNVTYLKQEKMQVAGRDGLYSSVKATMQGVPFRLELFVLSKEECIFDFSLVSPKVLRPSEIEEFRTFLRSFHYGKD